MMSRHGTSYTITAEIINGLRVDVEPRTVEHRPGKGFIYVADGPDRDLDAHACANCWPRNGAIIDNRNVRG